MKQSHTPKTIHGNGTYKSIWAMAAENNKKQLRVNRKFNPDCKRIGIL